VRIRRAIVPAHVIFRVVYTLLVYIVKYLDFLRIHFDLAVVFWRFAGTFLDTSKPPWKQMKSRSYFSRDKRLAMFH
jgi:hypothetical protein